MNISNKIETAIERLDAAIEKYKPAKVFALLSGGHDSFSASFVANQHPKTSSTVHINTGIGVPATRDFVVRTCHERRWMLQELKAEAHIDSKGRLSPIRYDDLVLKHGFPGPFGHGMMYNRLKERQLRMLERQWRSTPKAGGQIMLVSGCRTDESRRRMGTTAEVQVDGRRIWCAPIHDWTKADTSALLEHAKAERNQVVDLIHKSGECLCGAFADKGELAELALWPQTKPCYERIVSLEKRARAAGFPWGWGQRPPKEYMEQKRGQCFMEPMKQHLCWSCNNRAAEKPLLEAGA